MEAGVAALDWNAPWYRPLGERGQAIAARWQQGADLPQALNRSAAAPVRFVPQDGLPPGTAYETHIFRTRECPTRENLHDFFNGLCWTAFPRAKAQLNRLQAGEIERAGTRGRRGPVRDAITVFDENGALFCGPDELWDALLARDWRRLFVDLRGAWERAHLVIFGHALLEKLARPRKDMTAHVWCHRFADASPDALDAALAHQLTAAELARKPFTPLPVLGIPGWCNENQNFSFYDDSLVFRPAGQNKQRQQACAAPRLK